MGFFSNLLNSVLPDLQPNAKTMNDVEVFRTIANLTTIPDFSTISGFTSFAHQHGLQVPAAFLANTVLYLCQKIVFNGHKVDPQEPDFHLYYYPRYRHTFVWTLRYEIEGLYVATNGGQDGSVGTASALAKATLDELYDLYQAKGAMFEKNTYTDVPQQAVAALFMRLYQQPFWSKTHEQVKLRCYMMHYMHLAYYQMFSMEHKINDDLYAEAARKMIFNPAGPYMRKLLNLQ